MIASQPVYKKSRFWIVVLILVLVLGFWRAFRQEICIIATRGSCGWDSAVVASTRWSQAFILVIVALGLLAACFLVSLLLISQFVLPVQTWDERWKVCERLMRYATFQHGPAVFIKEGKERARPEEMHSILPGVAFVDLSSALVLERRWKYVTPQGLLNRPTQTLSYLLFRKVPPNYGSYPQARAVGPGIVFTQLGERIQGIADLRRQFRIKLKVKAMTRDGIEVEAHVLAIFFLGMAPEVLKVTYLGEPKIENLRVVQVDRKPYFDSGLRAWRSVEVIKSFSDELDEIDRGEIHRIASDWNALRKFVDDLDTIPPQMVLNFLAPLRIPNKSAIYRFISAIFADGRAALYRFVDHLTPVDRPEMFRFIVSLASLRRLINELPLSAGDRRAAWHFVAALFGRYRPLALDFYRLLDPSSRQKIEQFAQRFWSPHDVYSTRRSVTPMPHSPFVFDERRVFAALYSQSQNLNAGVVEDWTKLPTQVAAEVYRHEIAKHNYDDLYLQDDPTRNPLLNEIKPRFARTIRHMGVLSYQYVHPRDSRPPAAGDVLDNTTYCLDHPVQELHQSKPLRDRGIRVLHSSFTELKPSEKVRQQRIESWRARWQKRNEIMKAEMELDSTRLRNHARAQAQREMIMALSQILQNMPNAQEAMAMRVFQALETAATDPQTHRLLPRETIDMLRSLRHWLLPDETDHITISTEELPGDQPSLDGPLGEL